MDSRHRAAGMGSAGLARRHRGALDAAAGPPRSGTALVLFTGYLLLILSGALWLAGGLGLVQSWGSDPLLKALIAANTASLLWRMIVRFAFTSREYGWREGLLAVSRIFVSNFIAIMAGRRAMFAYLRTLRGAKPEWDKTHHDAHPAMASRRISA